MPLEFLEGSQKSHTGELSWLISFQSRKAPSGLVRRYLGQVISIHRPLMMLPGGSVKVP